MDNWTDECVGGGIYKECVNGWMGEMYDEFVSEAVGRCVVG
jgi:hypothetical protein